MRDENPRENHGLQGWVEKVKENNTIGREKGLIQKTSGNPQLINNTAVFNHFRHPGRKNLIKKGRSRWLNFHPGSPWVSPRLENVSHRDRRQTHLARDLTTFSFSAGATVNEIAVIKGGQHNE